MRTFAYIALALAAVSCSEAARDAEQPPRARASAPGSARLVLVDSVLLAESDTAFVGRPVDLIASQDGSYFVSDAISRGVLHFDRSGRLLRVLGKSADGSDSLVTPSWLALSPNGTLYVAEARRNRVVALKSTSGQYIWSREFDRQVASIAADGNTLTVGYVDPIRRHTLVMLNSAGDTVAVGGAYPSQFDRNLVVPDGFREMAVARYNSSTTIAAYEVSDYLYFTNVAGPIAPDSILVVVRARRGSRMHDLDRATQDPASVTPVLYANSIPTKLGRLSSGAVAYVSFDVERVGSRLQGPLFLSVVDTKSRRTCADARLPLPLDPQPRVTFYGDTLVALTQSVDPGSHPRTVIRKYTIDTSTCIQS